MPLDFKIVQHSAIIGMHRNVLISIKQILCFDNVIILLVFMGWGQKNWTIIVLVFKQKNWTNYWQGIMVSQFTWKLCLKQIPKSRNGCCCRLLSQNKLNHSDTVHIDQRVGQLVMRKIYHKPSKQTDLKMHVWETRCRWFFIWALLCEKDV